MEEELTTPMRSAKDTNGGRADNADEVSHGHQWRRS